MIVLGSLLMMAACTESFEDRCRREAREYTERMCPRVIAEYTMIDSMVFVEKPIGFTYYYNVSGPLDDPELMTDNVIEEFRNELERSKGLFIVEDETKRNERKKKDADSWGVNLVGDNYVGPNLLGRLLMELRDTGRLEYTLPADAMKFIEYLK